MSEVICAITALVGWLILMLVGANDRMNAPVLQSRVSALVRS